MMERASTAYDNEWAYVIKIEFPYIFYCTRPCSVNFSLLEKERDCVQLNNVLLFIVRHVVFYVDLVFYFLGCLKHIFERVNRHTDKYIIFQII